MLLRTTQRLGSIANQGMTRYTMNVTRTLDSSSRKSTVLSRSFLQSQHRMGYASSAANRRTPTRTIRIPPVPLALIGLGLACLGVGLYEHFTSDVQKYPTPVRTALRKALYYERKDPMLALPYFQQAFEEALKPDSGLALDGAPLTGILIQWGTLLERLGRLSEARQTLIMALRHLLGMENVSSSNTTSSQSSSSEAATETTTMKLPDHAIFTLDWTRLPVMEQKKIVGLCLKLGDVNATLHRDDEAEKCYVAAVEHLLASSSTPSSENTYGDKTHQDQHTRLFDQEHLPDWLTSTDVGVALATLGQFYASRKKYSYAIHLYLRALSLGGMDNCESTVLMNNLAESYVALNEFKEAKIWAEKGIALAQNPNTGKVNKDQSICDESCGILLFNLGMIFEQMQDREKAIQMYQQSIQHARQYEQMTCVQEALKARKRVEYELAREQQAKIA
ncbi:uncharacterized protein BX664DRAFT_319075 [Halteromyces radiatus]|uniref:uncharacterized protein n=1 Tax=Halteromyces radiatus TaxID=101107 RepID=UPI00221E5504|nr:uncharacterized protein BX664DRAFT_319075 [Halteromyces radiatus]KAI8098585.1 hypothetical protein BX664DRAFT_319075 [Halteromyces radiatus]